MAAAGLLLAVALIHIPVPPEQRRSLMRFVFEAGIGLILAVYIGRKVNPWIGALIALAVVSWVFATMKHGNTDVQRIAYLAKNAILCGGGSLLLFRWVDSKWIMWAMIAIATANFVFIAMQTVGIDPFRIFTFGLMKFQWTHPTGLMANKNETSALFAFCFFAFLRRRWWPLLWIPLVGLALAKSTGGVLALGFGLLFIWQAYGRPFPEINARPWIKTALIILTPVALVQAYVTNFDSNVLSAFTERFRIWGLGDMGIGLNPVTGVGIGLWPLATNQLHAHNEFIQAWFEMGFLSLIFIAGYAISVWSRMNTRAIIPAAAVVAVAVNCSISFPMHIPPTALIALAWIAILETALKGEVAGNTKLSSKPYTDPARHDASSDWFPNTSGMRPADRGQLI